MHQKSLNY